MYEPEVCNMKESETWKIVFEMLNIKFKNLWDFPVSKLDVLLETEFYNLRLSHIN